MTLVHEVEAIRYATALSNASQVAAVRLSGEDAFDVLDRICTSDLYLQDAQMRFSLLLSEDGSTLADLYVCRDDEDYLVLAEGIGGEALVDVFRGQSSRLQVRDLSIDHEVLSLHGPYAWELLAELTSPDVVGLPYLSLFHVDGMTCFRGGKTGEYGYDLLVPKAETSQIRERILSFGQAFDLKEVSLEAVDLCSLENWFFNARKEGQMGLGPIELGLQWRVSYNKEYVGRRALDERRKQERGQRITCAIAKDSVQPGQVVACFGKQIGRVLRAEYSPIVGSHVVMTLLDTAYAYSGVEDYVVEVAADVQAAIRTVSPPILNNRSLYVNVQKHSFATRASHPFPELR